jgi:hypothetical protein
MLCLPKNKNKTSAYLFIAYTIIKFLKRHTCTTHVYNSTIYNSQNIEPAYVSKNWWLDKENVAHIYNGVLFIHKED